MFDELGDALHNAYLVVMAGIKQYLPSVMGAVALLFAGWIAARVLRALTLRLGRLLDQLINHFFQRRGIDRPKLAPFSADLLGNLVFWLVILFFVIAATQVMGLTMFLGWLDRLVNYLPSLLAGSLIILAGVLLAKFTKDLILATSTVARQRILLARLAQAAILVTTLVIGADQIGIKITFLVIIATVVLSTVLGGVALALSLGARDYVANLIGAHFFRQQYKQGQRVRVGDVEGNVLEITPIHIVLETAAGRVSLPGKFFNQSISVLLIEEDSDAAA
jgi:small-conductance mechanosensitive channel